MTIDESGEIHVSGEVQRVISISELRKRFKDRENDRATSPSHSVMTNSSYQSLNAQSQRSHADRGSFKLQEIYREHERQQMLSHKQHGHSTSAIRPISSLESGANLSLFEHNVDDAENAENDLSPVVPTTVSAFDQMIEEPKKRLKQTARMSTAKPARSKSN